MTSLQRYVFSACLAMAPLTATAEPAATTPEPDPPGRNAAQEPAAVAGAEAGKIEPVEFERLPGGDVRVGDITLHRKSKELSFPARINQERGLLEVLIATPVGRLHESLIRTKASPFHLQTLLYLLGLKNGTRLPTEEGEQGDLVNIDLEWTRENDTTVREPVERWVLDSRTGKPMKRIGWVFVGSSISEGVFLASATGNIALLYSIGDSILDIPDPAGSDDTIFDANPEKRKPGKDAKVRVIISPREQKPPAQKKKD